MDFSSSYSAELTRSDETTIQETQNGADPCGAAPFAFPIAPERTFFRGLDFSRPQNKCGAFPWQARCLPHLLRNQVHQPQGGSDFGGGSAKRERKGLNHPRGTTA